MNGKNLVKALSGAVIVGGVALAGQTPATAHGSGVVKSCVRDTNCTNAVFAVCDPLYATTNGGACSPGRDVTIQLSNFGASKQVHVYFLNSEVDDPGASDCSQAIKVGSTELPGSPVTTSASGRANLDAHLPPGNTWSYGSNWICATTSAPGGVGGTIGDQLFTIYPA